MFSNTSSRGEGSLLSCNQATPASQTITRNELFIKIGSSTLVSAESGIIHSVLSEIGIMAITLQNAGFRVHIVSSGAVACGRHINLTRYGTMCSRVQAAKLGQELMRAAWQNIFTRHHLKAEYITLVDTEIASTVNQLQKRTQENIIVLNGDDVRMTTSDIYSRDNDKLVTALALQMNTTRVIFLSKRKDAGTVMGTGGFESKKECIKRLLKAGVKTKLYDVNAIRSIRWAKTT